MSLMGILDRVADVTAFDKAIEPARRAVQSVLRPQAVKDLLHGTWLGHPLHPVLAHVPVGSWVSAGLLDLLPPFRPAATTLIGVGVAAAVPTALAGAADWSEQAAGVRRLGAVHAAANTAALGLYVGSLAARAQGPRRARPRCSPTPGSAWPGPPRPSAGTCPTRSRPARPTRRRRRGR